VPEVVAYDAEAKALAKNWHHTIQFSCPGEIASYLEFGDGKARWNWGSVSMPTVALWFPNATLLNRMFLGKGFTLPIPWMGAWNVGLLKGFTELSKRLEFYLKPAPETLANRAHFEFHTTCLMNTALFGLKAVAEFDPHVRPGMAGIRDGVVEFRIGEDGPACHVIIRNRELFPHKGRSANPSVVLTLGDFDIVFGMLSGQLDTMSLIGSKKAEIRGFIPLVDKLGAALDRLPVYLN
jgi:hypothetical protein